MCASGQPAAPIERSVVSSFIFKFEDGTPRVALFRRSGKVSTYRHRLAPISGSITENDATPLSAAWREIQEETGLTTAQLSLFRQGKSYTYTDQSIGRKWTIYPFAFRLRTVEEGGTGEQGIRIDWEHEDWGWYDPMSVVDSETFGGVPCLAESLRRVWFEKDLNDIASKVLADGLERLQNDHQSGARQMAGVALQILRDVIATMDMSNPVDEWWVKVRFTAWHIWKNGRESMGAAILSVLLSALTGIEEIMRRQVGRADFNDMTECRNSILEHLQRLMESRADSAMLVSQAFARYIQTAFTSRLQSKDPLSILTLSESSTISQSIHHLILQSDIALDLRILESRPLYEGVALAGALVEKCRSSNTNAREPTSITIFSDASAAIASQGVDAVVIGADRIAASGAVSNKTGSLPAILSAKHVTAAAGRPAKIIVLSESEKVAPPGDPGDHIVEANDPKQLSQAWSVGHNTARVRHAARVLSEGAERVHILFRNVFFEWCPSSLIDVYITEFGEWTLQDIARHSDRLGEEEKRLLDSL